MTWWGGVAYIVRWAVVLALLEDVMRRDGEPPWERMLTTGVFAAAVGVGLVWPERRAL